MKEPSLVQAIEATKDHVYFHLSGLEPGIKVHVHESLPFAAEEGTPSGYGANPVEELVQTRSGNPIVMMNRFDGNRDRLYSRFYLAVDGTLLKGVRYVTRLTDLALHHFEYPKPGTIKGLQVRENFVEDAVKLGVKHACINLNQGDIMIPGPEGNYSTWELDGKTYYFDEDYLQRFDKTIKNLSDNDIIVSLILLNSPNWRRPMHEEMRSILLHPNYDEEGFISAFNLTNDQGLQHFKAFVEFAAHRYSDPEQKHGRVYGYIVGNEIDSQWVWGNAGEMPIEQYLKEYHLAMRMTFYATRKFYGHARVYISLTHLWTISHLDNPLRTYPARRCLELLNAYAKQEGNFNWSLAFHPYPEDLRYPDFWNDESATDSIDSPRITFKNIEQIVHFMKQEALLFDGRCRHIILSEQGFNSHHTDESEAFQAAAYALAYRKIAACPEIEAFVLHAHIDNLQEFGLNLGIWRVDDNNDPTTPKPIYEVFQKIDGPEGDAVYEAALPFLTKKMDRGGEKKLF